MDNKPVIEGVIFDNDGTLVDTESWQWQVYGIDVLSDENWLKYCGQGAELTSVDLIRDFPELAKRGYTAKMLLEQRHRNAKRFSAERTPKTTHYAKEAIEYFIKKKVAIIVASSAPRTELENKLKRSGLYNILSGSAGNFDFLVSGNDITYNKPNPEIYKIALKRMNIAPEKVIAFEDTQPGVEAAYLAGIIVMAVPNIFLRKQMEKTNIENVLHAYKTFSNLEEAVKYCENAFVF